MTKLTRKNIHELVNINNPDEYRHLPMSVSLARTLGKGTHCRDCGNPLPDMNGCRCNACAVKHFLHPSVQNYLHEKYLDKSAKITDNKTSSETDSDSLKG